VCLNNSDGSKLAIGLYRAGWFLLAGAGITVIAAVELTKTGEMLLTLAVIAAIAFALPGIVLLVVAGMIDDRRVAEDERQRNREASDRVKGYIKRP
jgi:hypothetical protein